MAAPFMPGLMLARAFYEEVVRPLLDETFPQLRYAAALLGPGSEVLGFDTERSTDHDWGPRLQVLLGDGESRGFCAEITAMFSRRLPAAFRGYPTAFAITRERGGPLRHRIEVADLRSWLDSQLGFDLRQAVTTADWLATPAQRLAEITAGAVFHDRSGELRQARDRLAWDPGGGAVHAQQRKKSRLVTPEPAGASYCWNMREVGFAALPLITIGDQSPDPSGPRTHREGANVCSTPPVRAGTVRDHR